MTVAKTAGKQRPKSVERAALRRRSDQFYDRFNRGDFAGCLALVDPELLRKGGVQPVLYQSGLEKFRAAFTAIRPIMRRTMLFLDEKPRHSDKRPFAYHYVVWQDAQGGFHLFQERWVKDDGRWYTRVAGLIPNQFETT
jgi:hypothetical protein